MSFGVRIFLLSLIKFSLQIGSYRAVFKKEEDWRGVLPPAPRRTCALPPGIPSTLVLVSAYCGLLRRQ